MAKQIRFDNNGTTYTLEFTRRTVTELEKRGFKAELVSDTPLEQLSLLFYGAFLCHHPNIKKEFTDDLLDQLGDKQDLWDRLSEMYAEPVNAFLGIDGKGEGKITWGANWDKETPAPQQDK